MPPLSIPPPSYRQVGPPPPTYLNIPPPPLPVVPVANQRGVEPTAPAPGPSGSQPIGAARPTIQPMRDAIPPVRTPSPPPEAFEPEPLPYGISVIREWTPSPTEPVPSSSQNKRGRPPAPKKKSVTKPLELVLTDITRAAFISALLGAHDLQADYRVSADEDGPPIKIWWQGSHGGRSGACTVETNAEFDRILNRLLVRRPTTPVSALFCTDEMHEWRVRKRRAPEDGFEEIGSQSGPSTKAPFEHDAEIELHAEIIVALKRQWECSKHRGDHGAPGFCYITATGGHIALTHLHMKIWAAAVAAGNATLVKPPEHDLFHDPNQPLNPLEVLLPARATRAPSRRAANANSSDPSAIASSFAMSFAASLAGALAAFNNPTPGALALLNQPPAAQAQAILHPIVSEPDLPRTPSPVPEPGAEIDACVMAFKEAHGIDLTGKVEKLKCEALGLDILPEVSYCDFCRASWYSQGGCNPIQRVLTEVE